MSAKGISKREAERLLRGLPAGQNADPLAELLAAVAVPGTAAELAGEEIAVATFRMALDSPVVVLGRPSSTRGRSSGWTAKAVTVKAVGLAMAVTAVCGGAVIAAGSASGPGPTVVPSATTPAPPEPSPSPSPAPEKLVQKHAPKAGATTAPGKKAQPVGLADLCRAFLGRNSDTAELNKLIKAAGGKKNVLGYCITLLGQDAGKPSDWPTWPVKDDKALERWIADQKKQWDNLFPH